ncbi:helix-turn-helix domain-containing protein [Thermovorax subterraneus]|nr:helix-turn-helix domain-containing protein [Thermovorax subterraneus]
MDFGERLQELRKEKGISRKELARALQLSYSAIAKYETNVRKPDQETLKKIADYFDVTVDYLLAAPIAVSLRTKMNGILKKSSKR